MKILIATGGTGGHIIPSLVTARELKSRGHTIVFAGVFQKSQAGSKLKAEGFDYYEISAKGFSTRSPAVFFAFLTASIRSFIESMNILKQVRPDVVAGFGGYGSFWVVFAAVLQGFPAMIQEQNVKPGKANKLLSFFTKRIAVGFDAARGSLPSGKMVVTGCPLRPIKTQFDRSAILAQFGLPERVPVILALGGSQGSRRINEEMLKAALVLKGQVNFSIIHICGEQDVDKCKAAYGSAGIPHCVLGFTDEIDKAYAVADLAVSRSGAMTVTELAAFALPTIFIPYPYAGGHQRDNAAVLAQTTMSVIIDEKDLTAGSLTDALLKMLGHKRPKDEIVKAYQGIYRPNAAALLADEIEGLKS